MSGSNCNRLRAAYAAAPLLLLVGCPTGQDTPVSGVDELALSPDDGSAEEVRAPGYIDVTLTLDPDDTIDVPGLSDGLLGSNLSAAWDYFVQGEPVDLADFEARFYGDNQGAVLGRIDTVGPTRLRFPAGAQAETIHWFEAVGDQRFALDCHDGGGTVRPCADFSGEYWEQWNRKHPQHAGPYEVARLAQLLDLQTETTDDDLPELSVNILFNYGVERSDDLADVAQSGEEGGYVDLAELDDYWLPYSGMGFGPTGFRDDAGELIDGGDHVDDFYPCHLVTGMGPEAVVSHCDDHVVLATSLVEFLNCPSTPPDDPLFDCNGDGVDQAGARALMQATHEGEVGEPYNVRYFEAGNETYGRAAIAGAPNHANNGHTCAGEYADYVNRLSTYLEDLESRLEAWYLERDPGGTFELGYQLGATLISPGETANIQAQLECDEGPWNEVLLGRSTAIAGGDEGRTFGDADNLFVVSHFYGTRARRLENHIDLVEDRHLMPRAEIEKYPEGAEFPEDPLTHDEEIRQLIEWFVTFPDAVTVNQLDAIDAEWSATYGVPVPGFGITEYNARPYARSKLAGTFIASQLVEFAADPRITVANHFGLFAADTRNALMSWKKGFGAYGVRCEYLGEPCRIPEGSELPEDYEFTLLGDHVRYGAAALRMASEVVHPEGYGGQTVPIGFETEGDGLVTGAAYATNSRSIPAAEMSGLGVVAHRLTGGTRAVVFLVNRHHDQVLVVHPRDVAGQPLELEQATILEVQYLDGDVHAPFGDVAAAPSQQEGGVELELQPMSVATVIVRLSP